MAPSVKKYTKYTEILILRCWSQRIINLLRFIKSDFMIELVHSHFENVQESRKDLMLFYVHTSTVKLLHYTYDLCSILILRRLLWVLNSKANNKSDSLTPWNRRWLMRSNVWNDWINKKKFPSTSSLFHFVIELRISKDFDELWGSF